MVVGEFYMRDLWYQAPSTIGPVAKKQPPSTYERDLWYPGPSTIGPVAKKQPPTTISSTDGTGAILMKYLKTLYGNLIKL